jgi:hypothetical protein
MKRFLKFLLLVLIIAGLILIPLNMIVADDDDEDGEDIGDNEDGDDNEDRDGDEDGDDDENGDDEDGEDEDGEEDDDDFVPPCEIEYGLFVYDEGYIEPTLSQTYTFEVTNLDDPSDPPFTVVVYQSYQEYGPGWYELINLKCSTRYRIEEIAPDLYGWYYIIYIDGGSGGAGDTAIITTPDVGGYYAGSIDFINYYGGLTF